MQEFNKENYYKQGGSKLLQETVNNITIAKKLLKLTVGTACVGVVGKELKSRFSDGNLDVLNYSLELSNGKGCLCSR